MASCHFCGQEMIWGGDHSFEDYGLESEGIVANLFCSSCPATADFYLDINYEEEMIPFEEIKRLEDEIGYWITL